ncbi:MAG TPA: AMP-binding protein [Candidatus Polarisedimenticolia bacterium]|nr:AMP-binding protein [Candidatus Polarisedimenticolia bacterium]
MRQDLGSIVSGQAADRPGGAALAAHGRSYSYRELDEAIRSLADGLARAGAGAGVPIALMLPNVAEFTLAYFASHRLGAPVVPMSVQLTAPEVAYHLEDSKASVLVAWGERLEQAAAGIEQAGGRAMLVAAGGRRTVSGGAIPLQELMGEASPAAQAVGRAPGDTAVILYTSGTTGRPKGAELTHANLMSNARVVGRMLGLGPETVGLCSLPLFHSFGQTAVHNAVLMAGGTVVLDARFDPAGALDAMERHGVTYFAGVPAMYLGLLREGRVRAAAGGAPPLRTGVRRTWISGGAPLPLEVLRAVDELFEVDLRESYGLSETSPVASLNRLDRPKRPGSIGVPLDGVELKLVDARGRDVEQPGQPGEIAVRGPNVMKGYHRRPEATAEAMRDGWLLTGDIARRDADGYYFIVDRKKDLILRNGYNVYPREVEEVLYAHPAVAEAAVVGVPDPGKGEEVKAFIVLREGARLTAAEAAAHCAQRLAAYKLPRQVEFLEALPRGPSGKILKRVLRER